MANGNGKKNSGDAAAASGTIDPGGQGFKKYPNQANIATMYLSRLFTEPGPRCSRAFFTMSRVFCETSSRRSLPSRGSRWHRSRTSLL